jgi:hypothetical protein
MRVKIDREESAHIAVQQGIYPRYEILSTTISVFMKTAQMIAYRLRVEFTVGLMSAL